MAPGSFVTTAGIGHHWAPSMRQDMNRLPAPGAEPQAESTHTETRVNSSTSLPYQLAAHRVPGDRGPRSG